MTVMKGIVLNQMLSLLNAFCAMGLSQKVELKQMSFVHSVPGEKQTASPLFQLLGH